MDIPGFSIERQIAKGGTATVYLATQQNLGRTVALKVLDALDDAEQSARFLAEGRIIAGLNHRHINTIHDVGRSGDHHYLAMEYLAGGSLAERIARGMTPGQALDVLESMASCLAYLHQRGVVHRDVKPGNILFHADGTPKLTDFGIAKQLEADQQHTLQGTALGSPYYLSPEQATGQAVDGRADIYSLGIVLYEMLTGRKPYSEDSHVQTMVAHLNEPIPRLPEHLAAYQPLLEQMIAKAPDERFASAAELLGYVRALRQVRPDGPLPFWQRPAFSLGSAGLLIATLVGAALLWPSAPRDDAGTRTATPRANTAAQDLTDRPPATAAAAAQAQAPAAAAPAPAEPAITTIPEPAPESEPAADPVADWLAAAEQAVADRRLSVPSDDSALHYYQLILERDPDHVQARQGLQELADRYHGMADRAVQRGDAAAARRYVERGLNIVPDHAGLVALEAELATTPADQGWAKRDNAIDRTVDDVKAWWRRNFD